MKNYPLSQIKKIPLEGLKTGSEKLVSPSEIKAIHPVHLKNIPFFYGEEPIKSKSIDTENSDEPSFSLKRFRITQSSISLPEITILPTDINGELSARSPFLNYKAYLASRKTTLFSYENYIKFYGDETGYRESKIEVQILCEENLTYLITFEMSPGSRHRQSIVVIENSQFIHKVRIDEPNQLVDIAVRFSISRKTIISIYGTPNYSQSTLLNKVIIRRID